MNRLPDAFDEILPHRSASVAFSHFPCSTRSVVCVSLQMFLVERLAPLLSTATLRIGCLNLHQRSGIDAPDPSRSRTDDIDRTRIKLKLVHDDATGWQSHTLTDTSTGPSQNLNR